MLSNNCNMGVTVVVDAFRDTIPLAAQLRYTQYLLA